jgi:hypothetical protein
MTLADSFGVIAPDSKRGVDFLSTEMLTRGINDPFTFLYVEIDRVAIAEYAIKRAKESFGWNTADFSRELFGEDQRQKVHGWLKRGLPAGQDLNVATKLGLSVEELLSAGAKEPEEAPLPAEAIDFARQWLRLNPLMRNQIKTLVLQILGQDLDQSAEGALSMDRSRLRRRRSA